MYRFLGLFIALLWALPAHAQTMGKLLLQVFDDEMELPIPGANVDLEGDATESALTALDGEASFDLPPGRYDVTVTKPGFRGVTITDISVQVARTTVQRVALAAGSADEQIEVVATKPAVDLEKTTAGTVLTKEFLQSIPAGRSYQSAVALAPGVIGGIPVVYRHVSNAEDYTEYGINGMTDVTQDHQSTFSIDVDTASYTIARRKLTEGQLPAEAAVRPEEFVNWLPYDYEPPSANSSAPFAVHLASAPNPFTPYREILRVGIKGRVPAGERRPVHLTFLVDTSGSMGSADKLGLAMKALHELVDNLGSEDTIALATYAGSNRKVLGPTPTTRKGDIHGAIDQLRSGGGTAMESGMVMAYQMASDMYLPGCENRVIVLSDGDANIGRTTHDEILRTIGQHAEEGITLTTVGFGMGNYKDTMMEQLANKGDGNYFYIDSFKEAQKVFGSDLSGTIETIARDVKIQVEFDPDAVHAYRLIGYENRDIADKDFRNDEVDAGEIGSGHSVTALYDVVRKDGYEGSALAQVHIRAKKPGKDVPAREWTTPFPASGSADAFGEAGKDFQIAWVAAEFAQKLKASPYAAETSWGELIELAENANRDKDEDADLIGNIKRAAELSTERAFAGR